MSYNKEIGKTYQAPLLKSISLILLLLGCNNNFVLAQSSLIDSLKQELDHTNHDTAKVDLQLHLSKVLRNIDLQQSIDYADQATSLALSNNYHSRSIEGKRLLGVAYLNKGMPDTSLIYIEEALSLTQLPEDRRLVVGLLNNLGLLQEEIGNFDLSLKHYFRSLELIDEKLELDPSAVIYNNIGLIYMNGLQDYDKAIEYFKKALNIFREKNRVSQEAQVLNNLGALYNSIQQPEQALSNFKESYSIAKKMENKVLMVETLNNIGEVLVANGSIAQAEQQFNKSLTIAKTIGYKGLMTTGLTNLVDVYIQQKKFNKARSFALKGLTLTKETKNIKDEIDLVKKLSKINEVTGNYKQAFEFQKTLKVLTDSLFNEQKNRQILELSSQHETERKETEIQLLKQEQTENESEIKRKTIFNWASGLVVFLVSILAYLLFQLNQKKQLYNKKLKEDVKLLNENLKIKDTLQKQSEKLQEVEQEKNRLFTNIAHELQTPLSVINGLTGEVLKSEQLSSNGKEYMQIIHKNSTELSTSVNQVLAISTSKKIKGTEKYVKFSFAECLDYILPEFFLLAQEKRITITKPDLKDQQIVMYSEISKFLTILKNLISNAIKYTEKEGSIEIDYQLMEDGFHQVSIIDNGRGISQEEIPNIFDRFHQANGYSPEGGFGLGLTISKEYIEDLGGTINAESTLGQGSQFSIRFPSSNEGVKADSTKWYTFPKINERVKSFSFPQLSEESSPTYDLLIVEDNKDFCKYLKTVLDQDYHLKFVHDGEQALKALSQHIPSLIITDWMMQGMDGLTLIRQLKANEKFQYISILMLTARSLPSDKLKAIQIGIDDYIIKPVEAEYLKNRISYLLNSKEDLETDSSLILDPKNSTTELPKADQDWLINTEKIIFPLINQQDLTLEDIAKLVNMSTYHLNRKIKTATGLTAKKYIQEIRYWEARRLIETKEYESVKAVCYSVGFRDPKHFSRKFKERFGQYPSEYIALFMV